MPKNTSEILTLLLESNTITEIDYSNVMTLAEQQGITPLEALITSGMSDERSIIEKVADLLGYTFVDLRDRQLDQETATLLNQSQAQQLFAIPLEAVDNKLTVAVPLEKVRAIQIKDDLRRITDYSYIDLVVATKKDISMALNRVFRVDEQLTELSMSAQQNIMSTSSQSRTNEIPDELNEESQVIRFVDLVIGQAIRDRASDIHFDASEDKLQIRYRVDGILQDVSVAPAFMMKEIASRIKIMARLDISKTRIPQDGRLSVTTLDNRRVDLRVATLPSVWGEKIVMRVLDNSAARLPLESLSFSKRNLDTLLAAARQKYGVILVTGPTGSGKSTTLYSTLNTIQNAEVNTITVEDPVEYQIKGITQIAANDQREETSFATILRTVLRSDPDIILVGEIRDTLTAKIAMQAGLTGHMVFSTLHTNDAASALTRLVEMEVEPFIIASTLTAVVSQRLIRKLCDRCKVPYNPTEEELDSLHFPHEAGQEVTLYHPKGCGSCGFKGYSGRIAIHEVLTISENMRDKIIEGAKAIELNRIAITEGMTPMITDGYEKAAQGITSVEEIVKVVG